jgi:xylulokinase
VVALDLSTTAAKAIAFDARGSILGSARAPLETGSPRPGWQEQDAASWWIAACASLRALTSTLEHDHLAAIVITHQRETFVCLDEHGEPLRPAILWLDSRPAAQVEALGSEEVPRISGRPPSTTASLYKLAWLGEHEPAVMARTAMVADVHAFLVHRLTGRWMTSWASADPLGLVDLRSFEYSGRLLGLAGIEVDQLPGLVPPASGIGEVTAEAARATGLPAGLPVIAGAGDGQCAALGSAVVRPGEASLNLGTSVTLGLHSDEYRTGKAFRTLASAVPERWMLEAALASGTHSIEWFRKQVVRDGSPSALSRVESEAANVPAGAEGLLFLPYLVRAETPFWDPAARGAWVGLRDHHGLGHLYRALLEGIALEQAMVLSMIEAETGVAAASVRVMGGGARSELWTRILADVLEAPAYVSDLHDATALGAAILAAASLGLEGETSVTDTARRMSSGWRQVPPHAGRRAAYGRSSRAYRMLYPALADVFAEIEADVPVRAALPQ